MTPSFIATEELVVAEIGRAAQAGGLVSFRGLSINRVRAEILGNADLYDAYSAILCKLAGERHWFDLIDLRNEP